MVGLAAGRLRHRVSFEEPIESQDPTTGVVNIAWNTVLENQFAEVNERVARESVGGGQVQETKSITITVRWRPEYDSRQRIVWQSPSGIRYFNISGLLPDTATARTFVELPVVELT